MRYDLDLFIALNGEYASKPLVPRSQSFSPEELAARSARRATMVNGRVRLAGKRFLEIGCGHGDLPRAVNATYGCQSVGVDVSRYREWESAQQGVTFIQADLSLPTAPDLGQFDVIYSNSVWEHLRHPFAMLSKAYEMLNYGGYLLLSANLYRGPKASHRYREVYFPWPHLLFSDEVFNDFYHHIGQAPAGETWLNSSSLEPTYRNPPADFYGPVWVNQLTIGDYYRYFELVGFDLEHVKFSMTPLDEGFLNRFADKLDRFPRYDLERDFIHAKLKKLPRDNASNATASINHSEV